MSVALSVAATKWARAVRERQAATAALRKAKLAARNAGTFSRERSLEAALTGEATDAKKRELRAEKALLKVIEQAAGLKDDVIDV